MDPSPRSSLPLMLAAALVLAVCLGWVILGGADEPDRTVVAEESSASLTVDGPREAELGALPDPGPRERQSDLVRATLTVLITTPGWATLPDSVEVRLDPVGDNPAEPRVERTRIGGAMVEFHDLLFGGYELRVEAHGFVNALVPVSVSKQAHAPRQVVPLIPAREIVGEVRNHRNEPVVGIEVSARPVENIPGFIQSHATTRTNEQGQYSLQPLPEGKFWVHVGQLRSPISDPVQVELRGDRVFQDLKLGALASVTFTAVSEADQSPIPAARIQVQRHASAEERGHMEYRVGNSKGEVRFQHLPPGEYGVTVIASNFKTTSRTYRIDEDATGEITISMLPLRQE